MDLHGEIADTGPEMSLVRQGKASKLLLIVLCGYFIGSGIQTTIGIMELGNNSKQHKVNSTEKTQCAS